MHIPSRVTCGLAALAVIAGTADPTGTGGVRAASAVATGRPEGVEISTAMLDNVQTFCLNSK